MTSSSKFRPRRSRPTRADPAGPGHAGPSRRGLLAAAAWVAGWVSGSFGRPAAAQPAQGAGGLDAFMAFSRRLTEKPRLDGALGQVLYEALLRDDAGFPVRLVAVQGALGTGALQDGLAALPRADRDLARRVQRAWYLGLVGEGEGTRCVAYEGILGYRPVADRVVMNSFCRGAPGYWSQDPNA